MHHDLKILRLLCLCVFLLSACSREPLLTFNGQTMGTWYTIKICAQTTEQDREYIYYNIDMALKEVNRSLNPFDPESEISGFNAYRGEDPYPVSSMFCEVAGTAQKVYHASQGAFDPTVGELVTLWGFGKSDSINIPSKTDIGNALKHVGMNKVRILENMLIKDDPEVKLDFSAIAKGYGVDVLAQRLYGLGYENLLVEIGGEVRTYGSRNGKPWRIGIAAPNELHDADQQNVSVINIRDMACATSGDYRQYYEINGKRYSHLIDPKTGYPINHELTSVTVTAESCMLADALATAVIVMGKKKGMELIESMENVEALFIYRDRDGNFRSHISSNWDKHLKK
jgi:FAD:protein FMN transferase